MFLGRPWRPGEPWFTDEDIGLALAWQAEQDARCPGCGHPVDETQDPASEGEWVASLVRCHACAAAYDATTQRMNAAGVVDSNPRSLYARTERITD